MAITVQTSGTLRHIGVLGHLHDAAERAELLELLERAGKDELLQVDFYDANTLPSEVIASIVKRQSQSAPLKIVTYHGLLTHSLMRLEIPAQQVAGKVPGTPLVNVSALALAGSANSLDKILHLIHHLPVVELAVFIVQHIMENQPNLLDKLLQTRTEYRVVMPHHLTPIEAGTIYVAPPGCHMKVGHGLVYLTRDRIVQYARPSIDALFESMASEYGNRAIAVLLCGYGQDGVAGCATLRRAGARVIVEDGSDCEEARILPDAAKEAGAFDYVLKLPAISSVVAAGVQGAAAPTGKALALFLEAIWSQYRFDFRGYQQASLSRRLSNIMSQFGLSNFLDFQCAILSNVSLFDRMIAEISVGVSEFFRHPEQFRLLREDVLPYLASFPIIKLWSAGCATGEEPYSLAILLRELGLHQKSRLFATDFNHHMIELATSGLFPLKAFNSSKSNYLKSGGDRDYDSFFHLNSRYAAINETDRKAVLFHRHSLVDEGVFNEFQIIVCRNVLIYFQAETQREVLDKFSRSLHRDGFLVLGPQDGIDHVARSAGFIPYAKGSHIYRRGEGVQNG